MTHLYLSELIQDDEKLWEIQHGLVIKKKKGKIGSQTHLNLNIAAPFTIYKLSQVL